MVVGVCRLTIDIAAGYSLKDKRHVVKSLVERIRHRFPVAVVEVDENEVWNSAVLGICCISNSSAHAERVLASVVEFVEDGRGNAGAALVDYTTEVLTGL